MISHKDDYEKHMKELFTHKCENSSDAALYPLLLSVFSERYDYMNKMKGECCRKKLLYKEI